MGRALSAMAPGRTRRSSQLSEARKAIALLETGEGIAFPSFTVATLPAAATFPNRLVHCSDGNAGAACLAYSNGTNWLRVVFGAAVATS